MGRRRSLYYSAKLLICIHKEMGTLFITDEMVIARLILFTIGYQSVSTALKMIEVVALTHDVFT
jgi:hypothetical protein